MSDEPRVVPCNLLMCKMVDETFGDYVRVSIYVENAAEELAHFDLSGKSLGHLLVSGGPIRTRLIVKEKSL